MPFTGCWSWWRFSLHTAWSHLGSFFNWLPFSMLFFVVVVLAKDHPLCRMCLPLRAGYNWCGALVRKWCGQVWPSICSRVFKYHLRPFLPHKPNGGGLNRNIHTEERVSNQSNSNLFIHSCFIANLMTQDQCYRKDAAQNHYFLSLLIFSYLKNHYKTQITLHIHNTYQKCISENITA